MIDIEYQQRVIALHDALGIPASYRETTPLSFYEEPKELVQTDLDFFGREQRLTPNAEAAWVRMRARAAQAGIELVMISAFRGIDYQAQLIRRKLDKGQAIDDILCVNAAPGYSEHHTGRAIDIASTDCPKLEEEFEGTTAFAWLQANAAGFGFNMSFARGNPCGIIYEPWHWCYSE